MINIILSRRALILTTVFSLFFMLVSFLVPISAEAAYLNVPTYNGSYSTASWIACTAGSPQLAIQWNNVPGAASYRIDGTTVFSGWYVDTTPTLASSNSYTIQARDASNLVVDTWSHINSQYVYPAPCNAFISVNQVGGSGGTWIITPDNISNSTSNQVYPDPTTSGSDYTITVNSVPASLSLVSITSSKGGSTTGNSLSMHVNAGESPSFTITYGSSPPPNSAPIVSAGSDRNITLPTSSVAASGASASDPDSDPLTYSWSNTATPGPVPTISGGNTLTPTFGNMTTAGIYTFQLIANDGTVNSTPDTMNVTVAPASPPPTSPDLTAAAPSPALATVGNPVTFTSSISNIGTGATGAGFNNLFEVATAAGGGGTRSSLSVNASAALAAGASANVNSSPYTFPSAGTFSVRTCADSSASIVESNEGNNCSGWTNVTVSLGSGGPYTVTATAGTNGTISPASQSVNSGSTTSFTVTPNSGYSATMSTTCAGGVGSPASGSSAFTYTTLGITSNCSVTASFSAVSSTTGSVTANNCTIALGASSCNTSVIWSTTNPVGVSQVTSNKNDAGVLSAGFVVGNGNSGGPISKPVFGGTPGTRSFFLYNNGNLIDSVNPSANCIGGSTWNGTTCAANAPDLTASASTTTSASVGTPVSFYSPSVSNIGTAHSGTGFNNLWQVNTAANGGGTNSTVSVNAMAALPQGSSFTATSSPYTFTSAGVYSVRICADMDGSMTGTITESNEGNNCSAWTTVTVTSPTPPDLVAAAPTPSVATAGTSLTFTSNISNTGTGSTGASFSNFFQLASAAGGGGTLSSISVNTSGAIAAGASSNVTSSSYTFSSAGTFSVRTCADNDASFTGTIPESNEGNNCSAWSNVTVSPSGGSGPDLTAGSALPTTATGSVGQTYTASISNIGTTGTGAPFSYFWQRASAAAGGGTIISLASSSMSALASGSSSTATSPSISFGTGTRSVRVCADFTGPGVGAVITETNEANNCGPWTDITVNAVQPAPTVTLTATPLTVNPPATTTSLLTWTSSNANTCNGTNFNTAGATSNSVGVVVTPVAPSTVYTITCVQNGPPAVQVSDSKTVNVGASGPKKPIFIEN